MPSSRQVGDVKKEKERAPPSPSSRACMQQGSVPYSPYPPSTVRQAVQCSSESAITVLFLALFLEPHCIPIAALFSKSFRHMEHVAALRDALSEDGDIELRFQGGHSIPVHSLKLKLASSVLKGLITAVLDDLIASLAAKRRRTAEGGSSAVQNMPQYRPYVQVSIG